jgi:hypothetical protein
VVKFIASGATAEFTVTVPAVPPKEAVRPLAQRPPATGDSVGDHREVDEFQVPLPPSAEPLAVQKSETTGAVTTAMPGEPVLGCPEPDETV